ncbi:DUF4013 domain-containing protein [Candidatus Dojkabacteria bacterium]|uniref:DUF4013 domain-containing protein n=1 Tax=Candidatus Dojkabacteria bacterium TaxID=2099670 RepID=A0A955L4M4_9BACT|nr:DUF4013 domain-containing protein [Candidatus Dojkabacteria bacterium]
MAKKQNSIDVEKAVRFFFELPDWKDRALKFAGVYLAAYVVLIIVYVLGFVASIIPILGALLFCGSFILVWLGMIAINFYFQGYKIEVTEAVAAGKKVEDIVILDKYQERVKEGAKLSIASFIYMLPSVILYFAAYAMMFIPLILTDGGGQNEEPSGIFLVGMLLFYVLFFIGWILQMIVQFAIFPAIWATYSLEHNFKKSISPEVLWSFIKDNYINIILFLAITMGMSMVMGFAAMLSLVLVLLCIGIVLYPLVFIVGGALIMHAQAHMVGQMIKQ